MIDGKAVADAVAPNAAAERLADAIQNDTDEPAADGATNGGTLLEGAALYEQGWNAGYAAAMQEKRPPLFEACKQAVVVAYERSLPALHALIDEVEAEYEQNLSRADRELLINEALRLQRVARARADGDRPVTKLPRPRRAADLPGPAATEYEHIA